MYAITGITGHVGSALANSLLGKNQQVRAVLRNSAKAGAWQTKGAEIAIAELHDSPALETAFNNTDGVFVMTPPLFDAADPMAEHDQMLAALSAAIERVKPGKVVYLSSIGGHLKDGTGAIKKLYDMEQAFQKLSVPTVGIRAGWFMENFTGSIAHAEQSGQFFSFLNPVDKLIPMIATKDIGTLAAELLQQSWTGHRIVELEGPNRYSANDVIRVLSEQSKCDITAQVIPAHDHQQVYQSFGASPAAAAMMAEMIAGFNNNHIVFEANTREQATGTTSLEDVLSGYIYA